MKRTLTIFSLLAAATVAAALASALTITISQLQNGRHAIVVTLSNSKIEAKHWAQVLAAETRGGVALLFCELPAGFYTALVLASE